MNLLESLKLTTFNTPIRWAKKSSTQANKPLPLKTRLLHNNRAMKILLTIYDTKISN